VTTLHFLELVTSLSVQAGLVVAATHWAARPLHERTQCRLWTACHVVLLGLVIAALALPHPRLVQPWSHATESQLTDAVSFQTNAGQVVLFVWAVGAVISLCLLVYRMFQVSRFLKTCTPLNPNSLPENTRENFADVPSIGVAGSPPGRDEPASDTSDVRKKRFRGRAIQSIRLLCSPALSSPFCWQFHNPCIVLPDVLLSLDDEELQFVIRHEVEHLRTGHPLQQFLQRVVEVLFWFHPMVWWASQRTEATREFLCDDAAIHSQSEIAAYLRTLLTIVEQGAARKDPIHAPLAFGRGRSLIAARAGRLVARNCTDRPGSKGSGLTAAIVLAVATVIAPTVWLPVNAMASSQSAWSPWPKWTAAVLHDFDIHARDFEVNAYDVDLNEPADDDSDEHDWSPVTSLDQRRPGVIPLRGGGYADVSCC